MPKCVNVGQTVVMMAMHVAQTRKNIENQQRREMAGGMKRREAMFLVTAILSLISSLWADASETKPEANFCWGGEDSNGRDMFVPCGEPKSQERSLWLTLRLDNFAGFRLIRNDRTIQIDIEDIWPALENKTRNP